MQPRYLSRYLAIDTPSQHRKQACTRSSRPQPLLRNALRRNVAKLLNRIDEDNGGQAGDSSRITIDGVSADPMNLRKQVRHGRCPALWLHTDTGAVGLHAPRGQ
jgi:hypothetical protein